MHNILIILAWLVAFYAAGFWGSLLLINNDSKILRYTVGKALGIILLAAITWVLSLAKILPFSTVGTWLVLIALTATTFTIRRKEILDFLKVNFKSILRIEIIILALFIVVLGTRMLAPKIEGVEKFMDMAILADLLRHNVGVPIDTWYAPETINYYYFGHWIVATLAKLSLTQANFAFNLGFASIIALAGGLIYAIVNKLTGKIWAGFLGIFLVLFASNMFIFISYFANRDVFFFNSGRFVEAAINEYPLYSVILGDLHAHVMGLVLSIALFGTLVIVADRKINQQQTKEYLIIGCLLGLMGVTNSFDIINSGVLLAMFFVWEYFVRKLSFKKIAKNAITIFVAFVLILAIFMVSFSLPVGGVQISIYKTPFIHIIWQFGLFFALMLVSFLVILQQPKSRNFFEKLLKSYKFLIVIFALAALTLVLITEIVYLKDICYYQNPSYARANTQYKIWYSAWIMLAIAAAAFYAEAMEFIKNPKHRLILKVSLVCVCFVALVGTASGYSYLFNTNNGLEKTLDGTNYLELTDPNKLAVIEFVNKHISGQPIILQYGGDSYSTNSWLSVYTGTSAYLGWRSHEWTWRYSSNAYEKIDKRFNEIKNAYEAASVNDLKKALNKTNAKYVLLGPDEKNAYKVNTEILRSYLGKPIFSSGAYELYQVQVNN